MFCHLHLKPWAEHGCCARLVGGMLQHICLSLNPKVIWGLQRCLGQPIVYRMLAYLKLEGTRKDYQIQLQAAGSEDEKEGGWRSSCLVGGSSSISPGAVHSSVICPSDAPQISGCHPLSAWGHMAQYSSSMKLFVLGWWILMWWVVLFMWKKGPIAFLISCMGNSSVPLTFFCSPTPVSAVQGCSWVSGVPRQNSHMSSSYHHHKLLWNAIILSEFSRNAF